MPSLSHCLFLALFLGAAQMSFAASPEEEPGEIAFTEFTAVINTATFQPQSSEPKSTSPPNVHSVALSRKLLQWPVKSWPRSPMKDTHMEQVAALRSVYDPRIPGPCQHHCDIDSIKPEAGEKSFGFKGKL